MGDVWIGAQQTATAVLGAIIRANPGPDKSPTTEPLDDEVVPTLTRAADFLEGYPETAEFASTVREIAFRYSHGRPTANEWKNDYRFAKGLEAAMMEKLTRK